METFRLKISKYDAILNKEVYDIIKDFNQFEDATKPYNGKVKKTIFDNGTKHKREQLIESVFSMKEVCADMFNVILSLVDRLATKATIADNITDIIEHSFNKLSAELSSNLSKAMVKPEINRVESEDKEKHVIILESKNPEEPKFDETAWNEVVKKKLSPKLKNVPIEKAMLCKNGKGCIFVSDKKKSKKKSNQLLNKMIHLLLPQIPNHKEQLIQSLKYLTWIQVNIMIKLYYVLLFLKKTLK